MLCLCWSFYTFPLCASLVFFLFLLLSYFSFSFHVIFSFVFLCHLFLSLFFFLSYFSSSLCFSSLCFSSLIYFPSFMFPSLHLSSTFSYSYSELSPTPVCLTFFFFSLFFSVCVTSCFFLCHLFYFVLILRYAFIFLDILVFLLWTSFLPPRVYPT